MRNVALNRKKFRWLSTLFDFIFVSLTNHFWQRLLSNCISRNFFFSNWNEANSLCAWCLIQITYFIAVDFVASRSESVTGYSFAVVISIKMLDYNVNLTI